MAVKAIYAVTGVGSGGPGISIAVQGFVIGGSSFNGDFYGLDLEAPNLNSDLAQAIKTYLSGSPHNVSFGSGDVVRMIPAVL